jgi:hypothetical protein
MQRMLKPVATKTRQAPEFQVRAGMCFILASSGHHVQMWDVH